MKQARILLFIVLLLLFSACSPKHYPIIQKEIPIAITINIKDQTISFIDLEKRKKLADWEMEKPYIGGMILPGGDKLLLYGKHVDTVDIYSLSTGNRSARWETGEGIVKGKLLENEQEIVFADQNADMIRFFTLDGNEIKTLPTEKNPYTLLEDSENERLIVASFDGKSLLVYDLNKKELIHRFPIHSNAAGAILLEDKQLIWMGGHGEGVNLESYIHIYDANSGKLVQNVEAPVMPINFVKHGDFIYTLSHGSNTLYKITDDGTVLDEVKVGANPFEITAYDHTLIVAAYDSNDVHFINPTTLQIEETVAVGKGPFQILIRERQTSE